MRRQQQTILDLSFVSFHCYFDKIAVNIQHTHIPLGVQSQPSQTDTAEPRMSHVAPMSSECPRMRAK